MALVSTLPEYPAPGRQTTVRFTLVEGGANYVRVWCTNAPVGSELRKKLDGTRDPRTRVKVYEGDGGENNTWKYTFDVGGVYTFVCQEYTKGTAAYGGGYQNSPDGAPSETKVGNEATRTIDIGQRIELPIGAGQDTASLIVWLWGDSIYATTVADHGEVSPAIQATAPTAKMLAVMESTSVATALATLAGQTATVCCGSLSALVSGYITDWNAHLANNGGVYHDNADTTNVLPVGFSVAPSADGLKDFVNEALRKMRQHFTNDAVDGGSLSGRDTGDYHNVSGKKNDNTNLPIVQGVSGPGDAYIGLADLCRCYTAHIASTTVHNSADSTNTLSVSGIYLLQLHMTVLDILASTSPTTPATFSSGAMILIQRAGGQDKPLEN